MFILDISNLEGELLLTIQNEVYFSKNIEIFESKAFINSATVPK